MTSEYWSSSIAPGTELLSCTNLKWPLSRSFLQSCIGVPLHNTSGKTTSQDPESETSGPMPLRVHMYISFPPTTKRPRHALPRFARLLFLACAQSPGLSPEDTFTRGCQQLRSTCRRRKKRHQGGTRPRTPTPL